MKRPRQAAAPPPAPVQAAVLYAVTVRIRIEIKTSLFLPGRAYTVNEATRAALGAALDLCQPLD